MSKAKFVNAIAEAGDLTRSKAEQVFNCVAGTIADELRDTGEINIPGVGKLTKTLSAPRKGRNPATGEAVDIPAKTRVRFKAARPLLDQLA